MSCYHEVRDTTPGVQMELYKGEQEKAFHVQPSEAIMSIHGNSSYWTADSIAQLQKHLDLNLERAVGYEYHKVFDR